MKVFERYEKLKATRQKIESYWYDIELYCMAGYKPFTKDVAQSKPDVYDSTAFRASKILSSGLYSQLTNPASTWFQLHTDPRMPLKQQTWIHDLADAVRDAFYYSGFYTVVSTFYDDLVHYGVANIHEQFDPVKGLQFSVINPHQFVFDEDIFGNVTDVFVEFEMSAQEAYARFGDNLPDNIVKNAEKGDNKKFKFLSYTTYVLADKAFPVYTEYYELETHKLIDVQKFKGFPYFIVRWDKRSGFAYGSSPSLVALPDVKMLNDVVKTVSDGAELAVNPAYSLPYDGYLEPITLEPGGLNYRLTNDPNDRMIPITNASNIPVGFDMIQALQNKINEAYFVDLFLMMQEGTMTATEVIQRAQEKMLLLGSVVGRLTHDFLQPLILRTIGLLIDYGVVNVPQGVDIGALQIKYLSPLQQSQKSSEYASIVQLLNTALQIGQYDPSVFDNINNDELIRKVGEIYAVPPSLFNPPDIVQQIRQQRAQQQAQMAQLQAAVVETKAKKQEASAQRDIVKAQLGK